MGRPRGMACTKASIGSLAHSVARSEPPCVHCTSQGGDAVRYMMPDFPCGCEACVFMQLCRTFFSDQSRAGLDSPEFPNHLFFKVSLLLALVSWFTPTQGKV